MKKAAITLGLTISFLFTQAQLTWLKLPDYPGQGRLGVNSLAIGNFGYIGMGYDGSTGNSDWHQYNPGSNTWTQMASLPSAAGLWSSVTFVINNLGYIVTGAKSPGLTNTTWEYNPGTNSWAAKATFPGVARENAAGFAIGTKGYVGTGYGNSTTWNDFYEYDQPSDTWTAKAAFPGLTRSGAAGLSIGSKGYIGVGNNTASTFNFQDFYEYDPSLNVWSQKSDFPLPYIVEPTEYSSSTNGYILGGFYYQYSSITFNPLNMMYKYDQDSDVWTLAGTFCGLPRGYAGGFAIGNDIYVGAGAQRNDGLAAWMINDFWKLTNGLTLAVQSSSESIDFKISPNPTDKWIIIDATMAGKKTKNLRIYDITGKMITTIALKNAHEPIDVSSLSKGMYFVELVTKENEVFDSKFIIQ